MESEPSVTLEIPAVAAWAILVRTAASAMCARLDFSVDRIEDVKLAVDEAVALLLGDAAQDARISVRFTPDPPDGIRVKMDALTRHGRSLDRDGFTWTVLTTLVDEVSAVVSSERRLTIELVVHRAEAVRP